MNLFDESAFSIDDCFTTRSEMFTYPKQMIFIYFRQCATYGGLQRSYSVMAMLINFLLDYAPYVVFMGSATDSGLVSQKDIYLEPGDSGDCNSHPFLEPLGLMGRRRVFAGQVCMVSLVDHTLYIQCLTILSNIALQSAALTIRKEVRKHEVLCIAHESQKHQSYRKLRAHDSCDSA